MPNKKNAKKMVRKIKTRTLINKMRVSRIKTFVKRVKSAISSSDKKLAVEEFKLAQPEVHRGVTKGVFTKNKAARIISRLHQKINKIEATEQK